MLTCDQGLEQTARPLEDSSSPPVQSLPTMLFLALKEEEEDGEGHIYVYDMKVEG